MLYLMESFVNKISNFIKETRSIETDIFARGEDLVNLLLQIFETFAACSSDNGTLTHSIEMLEN